MMRLLTTNQIHVIEFQGHYYNCSDALVSSATLRRAYLPHVASVAVLARSRSGRMRDPRWPQVDGQGVTVVPLPDPACAVEALRSIPAALGQVRRAARTCDAYCLKLPDATAALVGLYLLFTGRPYGAEVVADARQATVLAKGRSLGVLAAARALYGLTRFLVRRATAVVFLSRYLQNRYPHPRPDRQWILCSAQLTDEVMGGPRPAESFQSGPFRILAAGRLSPEKGHIHLLEALAEVCRRTDRAVEMDLLGDGPVRADLEQACRRMGIAHRVRFHGFIQRGPALFERMDRAHLYVLPSLTEGMGRGLIEAMARGLPCLASAVGGVPEYLAAEALFEPGRPQAIADKILRLIDRPGRLAAMSQANFESVQAFAPARLEPAQRAFWRAVGGSESGPASWACGVDTRAEAGAGIEALPSASSAVGPDSHVP